MVDTIYIEVDVEDHPRTQKVLARYPKANKILIAKYSEVFNSHSQNFRTQKQNPSLILASKQNKKVIPTPSQYETGGGANYYFSHMLNCVYDCRYCFLQGMLRSANYLLFVNYEEFVEEIKTVATQHRDDDKPVWFFSGYDCDSLAYEPVTQFADFFIDEFKEIPNAVLELRTKSTQIRSLLNRPAQKNVVVASSLSPENVAAAVEKGAPSLLKRLEALVKLQGHGWRIGLRFDPIVWHEEYRDSYAEMIALVFSLLDSSKIDSVTLGGFRLPKGFYKTMHKLYPEHWLFSSGLNEVDGMIAYRAEIESEMFTFVESECLQYISKDKLFSYPASEVSV